MNPINQVLAIDVGYSQVKFVSRNQEGVFPAVIAPEETVVNETYSSVSSSSPLLVDGAAFWVGDDAIYQPSAVTSAQNRRMTTDLAKITVADAIWKSGLEGDIILATGLPLDLFKDERAITETTWLGRELTLEKSGIKRKIRVSSVELMPQGVAALLYALTLKHIEEEWPATGLVVLIDLGERTTDVATVRADTLEPIRGLCFSIEKGVRDLKQQILRVAKEQLPLIPELLADEIMKTGSVIYRRQKYDFSQVKNESIIQFSNQVVGEIQTRFSASDALITLTLLAGGGAESLGEAIGKIYNSEVIEEPTMSNVLGYFNQTASLALRSKR